MEVVAFALILLAWMVVDEKVFHPLRSRRLELAVAERYPQHTVPHACGQSI